MAKSKLVIQIIRNDCIGDGACADMASGTFCMDREGIASLREQRTDDDEKVLRAARACPLDAIVIHDEESGQQLVPEE